MTPRLKQRYDEEIAPSSRRSSASGNVMHDPAAPKIVVNMGLGEAVADPKLVEPPSTTCG